MVRRDRRACICLSGTAEKCSSDLIQDTSFFMGYELYCSMPLSAYRHDCMNGQPLRDSRSVCIPPACAPRTRVRRSIMPAMANPWGPSAGNKLDAEAEEKSTPRCVRKGVCARVYGSKILRPHSRVRLSPDSWSSLWRAKYSLSLMSARFQPKHRM